MFAQLLADFAHDFSAHRHRFVHPLRLGLVHLADARLHPSTKAG